MRKRSLLVATLVLALLPLMDHADQATCCAASSSLASTAKGAVLGDEAFFKLPTGPSNVMFLLDNSGSMAHLPQCGDNGWDGIEECKSPALSVTAPDCTATGYTSVTCKNSTTPVMVKGTCAPKTDGYTVVGTTDLSWMESVTPQTGYADPGRTNSLLWDCPLWGNGGAACGTRKCSGNGCLFDPGAYYQYGSWSISGSSPYTPTATRSELDGASGTSAPNLPPCTALDSNGNPLKDYLGNLVSLGAACTTCMANRGFYIYKVLWVSGVTKSGSKYTPTVSTEGPEPLFKGTFLNANPPKFVAAKKVIKDVAWMDPAVPQKMDQVRLGLSILNSNNSSISQAKLIVPLGPDMNGSYPPTQTGFRQARQYILSVLNNDPTKYVDAVIPTLVVCDGSTTGSSGFQYGFFNPASGSTPLGSALFNVGQYFTQAKPPAGADLYTALFGATGCKTPGGTSTSCIAGPIVSGGVSEFAETSAGRTNAAWVKSGAKQCSYCWPCQISSVVVVTDGSPNSEIGFPTSVAKYDTPAYSMASNCNGTYTAQTTVPSTDKTFKCTEPVDTKAAGVPRVADWLHTLAGSGKLAPNGLRYDTILGGKERAFSVNSVGINIKDDAAKNILNAIAEMGGGLYENTSNPASLANAVYNAVNRVTPKEISFSAATSNSLQTVQTAASQAFITRFRPNSLNSWEGHVFEAFLFDEFLNGCDPTKDEDSQPTVMCGKPTPKPIAANNFSTIKFGAAGYCQGTYLIDLDCDQIVEDGNTGNFLKKATTTPANLPWDAGQVLSYESFTGPFPAAGVNPNYRSADETAANKRNIFTWIAGKRVDFTAANAATIQPYLNIDNSASVKWCDTFLTQVGIPLNATPSVNMLECARQIIYYVRGWDVLDQDGDGCFGPNNPSNKTTCQRGTKGEERDRPSDHIKDPKDPTNTTWISNPNGFYWKLGDISHSSPAVVQRPIAESPCFLGYEKQCVATIYSPPLAPGAARMDTSCPKPDGSTPDCYQDYRDTNLSRPRVLLVGANDGMLHAFDAGTPITSGSKDMFDNYEYSDGTGAELWAFIPPDMLPRLKDLLSAHQYMVDGSVLMRDVWVDGSDKTDGQNTPAAPAGLDGIKQTKEFHTVAIFGRRSGGNMYSALDVTDPLKPTLIWSFPQCGSDDARYMGQSWGEGISPRPPAIGPVRMAVTGSSPAPDVTKGFSERWIIMLGGGYDPTLTLGRAVFTLDAWTGQTLWRFTDDDFKANLGFSGASAPSMFPVPAGIGMVDIGVSTINKKDSDGFFDTATWGDTGGNLWVARLWAPGVIDPVTKRVNNWYAARAFEQLRRLDNAQYVYDSSSGTTRNEFYYMTVNAFEPQEATLHTYLGSGNREQLMSQSSTCGSDDLFGCVQAGCTSVTATSTESYGSCGHSDTFSATNGLLAHTGTNTCTTTATCAAGGPYVSNTSLTWTCPGSSAASATGSATCDANGICSIVQVPTTIISGTFRSPSHRRFYGIASFGRASTKAFGVTNPGVAATDLAAAKVFDQNRLTDIPYSGTCNGGGSCTLVNTTPAKVTFDVSSPMMTSLDCVGTPKPAKCTATETDPGWYYEYGQICPLETCATAPPWTDEKTGPGGNLLHGCLTWGGFRPYGVITSTDPCSGNMGVPTVNDYAVDYVTGVPGGTCNASTSMVDSKTAVANIASPRSVTAAPGGGTVRVDVTKKGQVGSSVLHLDSGSSPSTIGGGVRSSGGTNAYWLEVPLQLHQCRHVSAENCN